MRSVLLFLVALSPLLGQTTRVEGRVVTPDGRPVAKANVRIQGQSAGRGEQAKIYIEVAGSNGSFAVDGIAPGSYQATAQMNGYNATPSSPYVPPAQRPGAFTIATGETYRGLEIVLVSLGIVSGVVVDRDGDPVRQAQVTLLHYGINQGRLSLIQGNGGQADDRGQFRMINVQPDQYYLRVISNNQMYFGGNEIRGASAQEANLATFYPNSADVGGATRFRVGDTPVENLLVRMLSGRTYTIRGTVEGAGQDNLPTVAITPKGQLGNSLNVSVAFQKPPQFEIRNVPPGDYVLYSATNAYRRSDAPAPRKPRTARVEVVVANGDVENVDLRPEEGFEITGRLRSDDGTDLGTFIRSPSTAQSMGMGVGVSISRGVRIDPAAVPQTPLTFLNLMPADEGYFPNNPQIRVQEDGTFAVSDFAPGSYVLNAENLGGGYIQSLRFGDRDFTHQLLQISSGGKLDIVVSKTTGKVNISWPSHLPESVATDSFLITYIWPATPDRSDPNGRVVTIALNPQKPSIPNLPPGDYYIAVFDGAPLSQDFMRIPEFLARFNNIASRVTVPSSGEVAVDPAVISREAAKKAYDEFP